MQWFAQPPLFDKSVSKWTVNMTHGEPPLPERDALERIIKKHVPEATVSMKTRNSALVEMPFDVAETTRAIISNDVRTFARAQM